MIGHPALKFHIDFRAGLATEMVNGNIGTNTGVAYVAGEGWQSAQFDADGDRLVWSSPTLAMWDYRATGYTWLMRFKVNSYNNQNCDYFGLDNGLAYPNNLKQLAIYGGIGTNSIIMSTQEVGGGSAVNNNNFVNVSTSDTSNYHTSAMVRGAGNSFNWTGYFDETTRTGTGADIGWSASSNSSIIQIGYAPYNNGRSPRIQIDKMSLFAFPMSAMDIKRWTTNQNILGRA